MILLVATPTTAQVVINVPKDHTNVWLPFVAAVGGWMVALVGEWLRARFSREQTRAARRQDRLDRHNERQRANLEELQDTLADLMRAAHEGRHADVMAYRNAVARSHDPKNPPKWPGSLWPEGVSERMGERMRRAAILESRCASRDIRNGTDAVKVHIVRFMEAKSDAVSESELGDAAIVLSDLSERIGTLIRGLEEQLSDDAENLRSQ